MAPPKDRGTPAPVEGLGGPAIAIAAGQGSSFAVMADGAVMAWGWNYQAQLGDGSTTSRHRPVPVRHLSGGVRAIVPGTALRVDGAVVAWGGEDCAVQSKRDQPVSLGETRLGGMADLPRESAWPSFEGRPMAFVAQVDLTDLVHLDSGELLPPSGLLSFFCSTADLDREGSWHVVFTDAGTKLTGMGPGRNFPTSARFSDRFGEVGLRPQRELTPDPLGVGGARAPRTLPTRTARLRRRLRV